MYLSKFFLAAYFVVVGQALALPNPQAASSAMNTFTSPTGESLDSGTGPIQIAWIPGTQGTVTITLVKGPEGNQQDAFTVATAIGNSGSYSWDVPKTIQDSGSMNGDKYALKIIDDATQATQSSAPFDLKVPGSTFQSAGQPAPSNFALSLSASQLEQTSSSSGQLVSTSLPSESSVVSVASIALSSSSLSMESSTHTSVPTAIFTSSSKPATSAVSGPILSSSSSTPNVDPTSVNETSDISPTSTRSAASIGEGPKSGGSNTNVIIGAIVGSVVGLALFVGGLLFFARYRRRSNTQKKMRSSGYRAGMAQVEKEHENYMINLAESERVAQEAQEAREREEAIREYDQSRGMVNAF